MIPLARALDGCIEKRLEWTLGVRLEPLELELHDFVALAGLHRSLVMLDVDDVVVVSLDPWLLVLGVAPGHVLELGLVAIAMELIFLCLAVLSVVASRRTLIGRRI